jgi:catechol 2,3-dioxygenase-like lactoylglutathione lyase family enzyme/predicted enzyme related to lactoylglutathione lyase
MQVTGVCFIGINVLSTGGFSSSVGLFRDVVGLELVTERFEFVAFRTPDGDQLEVFGRRFGESDGSFSPNRVVCGFRVDDIDAATSAIQAAGLTLLGPLQRSRRSTYAWQGFRGPDGLAYQLTFDPNLSTDRAKKGRMGVRGISWVGVKTDRFDAMTSFCRSVLGLPLVLERPDFAVYRMLDGDKLELFGPSAEHPPHQFTSNRVVCGLLVDDIARARNALQDAGVELLGDLARGSQSSSAWQHFRGPDGFIYELTFDSEHP